MNNASRSQDAAHPQDTSRPQDANPLKDAAFLQAIAHLQEAARPQEGEEQQASAEVKTYGGGFWRVTFFDEVDSTNNCVKEAIPKELLKESALWPTDKQQRMEDKEDRGRVLKAACISRSSSIL